MSVLLFAMSETSIPLTKAVRDRLKEYGKKDETYASILTRLMDRYDEKKESER